MKPLILIVDADPLCRDTLRNRFHAADYDVSVLYDTAGIAHRLTLERPALLLIASGTRVDAGLNAVKQLRQDNDDIPVIMLGEYDDAHHDATDRIVALECGADDFVTKPFNVDEVLLRVRNVLKRAAYRTIREPVHKPPFLFDGFKLDFLSRSLTFNGRPVSLSENEYALLTLLVNTPGKVLSRSAIAQGLSPDAPSESVGIWVHRLRSRIRRAAGACNQILTVHGMGYAFHRLDTLNSGRNPYV